MNNDFPKPGLLQSCRFLCRITISVRRSPLPQQSMFSVLPRLCGIRLH
ncbi:hypothetical protein V6Z12_D08G071800 [Gossypium hirsutum]